MMAKDCAFSIVDERKLWMLQTRTGKRNGAAAIRIAMDMLDEGLISEDEALLRISPENIDEIMHDTVDPDAEKSAILLGSGLPAGPGGATGQIFFTADDAENGHNKVNGLFLCAMKPHLKTYMVCM